MPIVASNYKGPPFFYLNGHFETIIPSMTRKIKGIEYSREQIETPDDDFLNLDWLKNGHNRLLIISHGLEGGSDRHYAMGMAKLFSSNGWDVLAWNNRSCNGEMNRQKILYHHAASYDVRTVVDHALATEQYAELAMVGMSMGGGQTIRYLGEESEFGLPDQLKKAVVISVPCSLPESVDTLGWRSNAVYEKRFLGKLKDKLKRKAEQYPEIDVSELVNIKKLEVFDEMFSAPLHGFESRKAFYEHCNPLPFISKISRDLLILNALNDPLLIGDCFPYHLAEGSPNIYLETPKRGGHVGFVESGSDFTYSELRTLEFLTN
ncbi:YheT family hydrolase [Roseivirga sp. E12]|uniref:YheT family hydrolase n=1 Tax=Roseivirga sp. E12 TaxID=2819237 RepID=UPI001ABCBE71|nr:alpha/beta fold hydrolase [Roseivirga sp. E12]MBO3696952.1 alpha/beta fold hydrolase [Roseivirga sp. E12]